MGKKRKSKMVHAAHIKRSTEGTSNELSFSVLDAAKNATDSDEDQNRSHRFSPFGKISLFTLPRSGKDVSTPRKEKGLLLSTGDFISVDEDQAAFDVQANSLGRPSVTTAAGSFPLELSETQALPQGSEVFLRKTKRKRKRFLVFVSLFIVFAVLVASGGWWFYTNYQEHESYLSQLDQGLDGITSTNEALIAVDETLAFLQDETRSVTLADDEIHELKSAQQLFPSTVATLQEARFCVEKALGGMLGNSEQEAATQAQNTIDARLTMLDAGSKLIDDALAANETALCVQQGWETLLSADLLAREAASLVVNTTDENVTLSKEKTEEAKTLFVQAQADYRKAAQLYVSADLQIYEDYLAKRIEALDYALASDEAFLNRNREEASAQNDAYNQADTEAASLAQQFPRDSIQPIRDASLAITAPWWDIYLTARLQARSADAFLGDYLGISTK